jgi:hypothetical protein
LLDRLAGDVDGMQGPVSRVDRLGIGVGFQFGSPTIEEQRDLGLPLSRPSMIVRTTQCEVPPPLASALTRWVK